MGGFGRDSTANRSARWRTVAVLMCCLAIPTACGLLPASDDEETIGAAATADTTARESAREGTIAPSLPPTTSPAGRHDPVPPGDGALVAPSSSGHMWSATVPGLLTFRGNPTRTYYGRGSAPTNPTITWSLPATGGLCSESTVGDETKTWCGTGWTGQPAVFERDGRTWVVFGAYDGAVHFVDAATGEDILEPFRTGDIIKGSVTVDPDGYPLVYTGSRDNFYRVLSIEGPNRAVELWKLSATAVSPTLWNNDWDGSALVLDDYLLEGGENSQFHMVKLNRGYDAAGQVTVAPTLVFNTPSWDVKAISDLAGNRSKEMSIESSVAVSGNTVYWANSGGLIMGWDLGPLVAGTGKPVQTFRFWTGDDTDATIVIDGAGKLYVASEYERANARGREVGQLMKLDPANPDQPIVWSYKDQATNPAGIWATPALHRDVVIAATNGGKLFAVDAATGAERWAITLPGPTWQSPVIVDDVLVYGDCGGTLRGYDVADTSTVPRELWSVKLGGCVESTPAVWDGRIFVGTRSGKFFALHSQP